MKGQMYLRKMGFLARVGAQLVAHPENNVHRLEGADPDLPMMSASSSSSPFETCQTLGDASSKSNTLGASFPPPAKSSLVQRFSRNSLRRASVGSQNRTEPEPAAPVPHSATASPPTMDLELDVHAVGIGLRFLEWESGLRGLQVTSLEPLCCCVLNVLNQHCFEVASSLCTHQSHKVFGPALLFQACRVHSELHPIAPAHIKKRDKWSETSTFLVDRLICEYHLKPAVLIR